MVDGNVVGGIRGHGEAVCDVGVSGRTGTRGDDAGLTFDHEKVVAVLAIADVQFLALG